MKLHIVGIGPGAAEDMTIRAYRIISEAELIVGYTAYNEILRKEFPGKNYYETSMRKEEDRCLYALKNASDGIKTALVCSGDSGIYGMAALVYELAGKIKKEQAQRSKGGRDKEFIKRLKAADININDFTTPDIEIASGVTAAASGAALAGSPLTNDFAVISLSDLLTPWQTIQNRINAAAQGDFAIAFYNAGSKKRKSYLKKACDIILKYRSPKTPCAAVGNISRDGEYVRYMTLAKLRELEGDMAMTVFIGNSVTEMISGKMVTPRGYLQRRKTGSELKNPMENISTISESMESNCNKLEILQSAEKEFCGDRQSSLLIFGGTVEGRILAQEAVYAGYDATVCVATEYGREVLKNININNEKTKVFKDDILGFEQNELFADVPGEKNRQNSVRVISGGLSEAQMKELMDCGGFAAVFDATHPYASEVTENIKTAAEMSGLKYLRIRRNIEIERDMEDNILELRTIDDVIEYLNTNDKKAFISTGSKNAEKYAEVKNAEKRLTIRILPSEESISKCKKAGFQGKNLICMQGPFSREMNEAMFKESEASILVTKASGRSGGFTEKVQAALDLGMKIIALMPPEDFEGISLISAAEMIKSRRITEEY
ncbi:MAG: precorrin-6A reductase [Firmicutes bacterium]|nr:precorrin-6A reductase [Bacillota bacterium]